MTDKSFSLMDQPGTRRGALKAALAGSALLAAGGAAGRKTTTAAALPFDSPQWNLDALVRINGAGNGRMGVWWAQGRVFGMPEKAMRQPLMGITGCRMVQYERVPAGYTAITRDFAFFTDLATGEPLSHFDNPYTGRQVPVKPILTKRHLWTLTPDGQTLPEDYKGVTSSLVDRPFKLAWMVVDGEAYGNLETFIRYPNGAVGSEILTFASAVKDIANPRVASVPATFTWVNESGWFSWLDMAGNPGGVLMVSSGAKVAGVHALPPTLSRITRATFPGLLDAPWTWQKPAADKGSKP